MSTSANAPIALKAGMIEHLSDLVNRFSADTLGENPPPEAVQVVVNRFAEWARNGVAPVEVELCRDDEQWEIGGWSYWKDDAEIVLTFPPSTDCPCIDCVSWFEQQRST